MRKRSKDFLATESIGRAAIDLIGFHGQTVVHRPARRLTVQIGDGAGLAGKLGIKVAFDFRAADVAEGGQGAPLVPVFHRALAAAAGFLAPVAVINIGGVANLSFIAPGREPIACDTGPGNALLDDLLRDRLGLAFDQDGAVAAARQGRSEGFGRTSRASFFRGSAAEIARPQRVFRRPGRAARNRRRGGDFDRLYRGRASRACCRICRPRHRVAIVCGGGARNKTLMRELADRLPCPVVSAEAFGWSADAMEAQAFAYLAVRRLKNLPITFPMTTGVKQTLAGGNPGGGNSGG